MSKKNLIFILLTVVSGLVFLYFLQNKNQNWAKSWKKIIVTDIDNLEEIRITKNNKEINLSNENQQWMVNKNSIALPNKIENIKAILQNFQLIGTAPMEIQDSLKQDIQANGKKISIKTTDKTIHFWIGNPSPAKNGTFILPDTSQMVVIIKTPGFSYNLNQYFPFNESDYRSKAITKLNIEDIQQIKVSIPNKKELEFTLKQIKNQGFTISDYNNLQISDKKIKRYETIQYFTYFTNLEFEYNNEKIRQLKDSIIQTQAFYTFEIQTFNNKKTTFSLYKKTNTDGTPDYNRLYVYMPTQAEIAIITYFAIDPLLKDIQYFIRKETSTNIPTK